MFNQVEQVEIMLYVNDPEKCAKFWSKEVGFIANFPGFYNSMSKKPTITAFFEV